MIKIDKSLVKVPNILASTNPASKGVLATEILITTYDQGKRIFEFDANIYGNAEVKQTLKRIQHDKCCFCESKISHIAYGDVEHFRPKGGYQNALGKPLIQPGYYWLAYNFGNLLLACQICNQKYKRNFFPLLDESKRVKSHHDQGNLHLEDQLIIDPNKDNPEDHIYFDQEIPKSKDLKGELTIQRLGLDRDELNDYRLGWLRHIRSTARHAADGDLESLELLIEAASAKSVFSLMVRSNFPFLAEYL